MTILGHPPGNNIMPVITAMLHCLPGFDRLDTETLEAVRQISQLIEVPAAATLCLQGAPAENLHYLLDGQVTLTQTEPNGVVGVIDVLQPVRGIGLANVLIGECHPMTARALTPARLLTISGDPLRQLVTRQPTLAGTMLQGLSLDLDSMTRHVIDLKLRNAAQRLGCYLLRLAHGAEGNTVSLRLPVRKQLLAAQLGCRHENLSRAFGILRAFGVETSGARVTLHDIPALRRYAVPDDTAPAIQPMSPSLRSARAFSSAFSLR